MCTKVFLILRTSAKTGDSFVYPFGYRSEDAAVSKMRVLQQNSLGNTYKIQTAIIYE